MFGFKKKEEKRSKNPNQTYIALDIGTEFVKTAIYKCSEEGIEVVGFSRVRQKESTMYAAFIVNLDEAIDKIDQAIGEALELAKEIMKEDFVIPKEAIVGIAGELIQGVVVEGKISREVHNSPITSKEIESIKAKLKETTFESTRDDIALEIGMKPEYIQEIDSYINSVYVDGVRVVNPVGYVGEEMIYKVFTTFGPKAHLATLNEILKRLDVSPRRIVVEPYALSLAIKGLRDRDSNGIIVDIGGGTTDIAVVSEGDIVGTRMFAIGGRVVTKSIKDALNISYIEADELKTNYTNGKIDPNKKKKISPLIERDINIWLTGMEISLEGFENFQNQVTTFYLCGGGALLTEVQEGLLSYPWVNKIGFAKQPRIDFVFPTHVEGVVDKTRSANMPMDVTVLALARMHLDG